MAFDWRKSIFTLLTPKENKNSNSILYWREKIFYNILLGGAILGLLALIPSVIYCFEDKLYVQIVVDIAVYIIVIIFLFNSKIPYKIKTSVFLLLVYLLGLSIILTKGPYASGFVYLVSFSIVASVWRGTKVAIITIVLNMLTLIVIGFLCYNNIIIIKDFVSYNLTKWFSLGSNLFLANTISAVSVGLLLDGLERTINQTLRLKNQLNEEKIKLEAAKKKAEEADKLKTAFLGNMSHELKTPLNAIIGFSNFILDEKIVDSNEIFKYQKIIAEGGEMLLGLINDILDITVIESGQLKIEKREVYLKEIVAEISNTFDKRLIDKLHKNIKFNIVDNLKMDEFCFTTDPLRVKQVMNNLIKNALKFTNEGEISFSYQLSDDKKYLSFSVQDTGIGIPLEKQSEIFNRFSKLNDTSNNEIKGTGLGLAISKEIVELLGGKIWVESVYGKGSTFYFTVTSQLTAN